MTQHPDLFAALAAPFDSSEVKVRTQAGRQLHYVTARTIANRLDEVLGPENWWDRYRAHTDSSVICALTIRLPDGSELTKEDAGACAGMADEGDDDKSAFSDALKRAASKFGPGRYLARDGVPRFVRDRVAAQAQGEAPPAGKEVVPDPTRDPARQPAPQGDPRPNGKERIEWAGAAKGPHPARPASDHGNGSGHAQGPPRTGKALFAWTKDQEAKYEVGLLKYLNQWAKLQEFPGRMVDWDGDQVAMGYAEACRKLKSIEVRDGDSGVYEEALAN